MDVKKETVFSLAGENPVMEGCTISSLLSKGEDHFVFCFSLAKDTGISGEIYAAAATYCVEKRCRSEVGLQIAQSVVALCEYVRHGHTYRTHCIYL